MFREEFSSTESFNINGISIILDIIVYMLFIGELEQGVTFVHNWLFDSRVVPDANISSFRTSFNRFLKQISPRVPLFNLCWRSSWKIVMFSLIFVLFCAKIISSFSLLYFKQCLYFFYFSVQILLCVQTCETRFLHYICFECAWGFATFYILYHWSISQFWWLINTSEIFLFFYRF